MAWGSGDGRGGRRLAREKLPVRLPFVKHERDVRDVPKRDANTVSGREVPRGKRQEIGIEII